MEIVEEFLSENGFGMELQKRLEEYAKDKDNWLQDIWLRKAYLEWREPSLINVNYWCEFVDHPDQPKDLLIKPPPKGTLTAFQIKRAAGLITNFLNVNDLLNSQLFPPEFMKKSPLCMDQYKRIFATTRIPGQKCDSLVHQYPTRSTHIIVLCRDLIYKVPVVTAQGRRVCIAEIERVLLLVGRMSLESVTAKKVAQIGVLTAGHRDDWYNAYTKLTSLHPQNKENMSVIQSALFAVCLDDAGVKKNKDESHQRIFHNDNALNRWFDKSLQIIVSSSGRAGVNGEHSPSDAVVPGTCIEHVLKNEPALDAPTINDSDRLDNPTQLDWTTDPSIHRLIQKSKKTAKDLIQATESCLLHTDIYGSRFIKEVAATSPDAYIQMALQLTWWRMYKKPTPVYESASTRLFKGGRTETGRSTSEESLAFCKSFDDDQVLYEEKRRLFREAVDSQSGYMRDAVMGKGIDRHMLGLRYMIKPEESEKATMFTDPSYTNSMWFRLSTSNMSPGKYFYGGFGPVVPDGYGINYAIDTTALKFSISSNRTCPSTSSYKFRERLEQTLIDMMVLFPKRTEVWGYGWEKRFEEEDKGDRDVETMRKLTAKK